MLGDEAMNGPFLNRRAAKQRIEAIASQYRLDVPPDAIVEDLSVGAQQRVVVLDLTLVVSVDRHGDAFSFQ
jgi:simple sugar transport system ATP-binding protein